MGDLGVKTVFNSVASGATPNGIILNFPIGQEYTSYRNGDEGFRLQNNWFDYNKPAYPKVIAELDNSLGANRWFSLKNPLTVGGVKSNTRFVDLDGLQNWGAADNIDKITIDKFAGLGFYRVNTDLGAGRNWNDTIDFGLSLSITAKSILFDQFYLASREEIILITGEQFEQGLGVLKDQITTKDYWIESVPSSLVWTSTTQSNSGGANAYYKGWNPSTYITGAIKLSTTPYGFFIFDAKNLIS